MRSALVLKLLTSAEHGSIAAAATFGLPRKDRRRAQLGLSLLLDPRRGLRHLRADAARLCRRGAALQRMGVGARRCQRRRRPANPLSPRRLGRGAGDDPRPPFRLSRFDAGAHRQRRRLAAAARHLRRPVRLRVSRRQVRRARHLRDLAAHVAHAQLGVPQLGAARRGHLGDPRRAPALPVVAADVLGRARSWAAAGAQALAAGGGRGDVGKETATSSTATSTTISGTRSAAPSCSTRAPTGSMLRRC